MPFGSRRSPARRTGIDPVAAVSRNRLERANVCYRQRYGAFNSAKAALRVLAQAMAKEDAAGGIHAAHVVVDDAIAGDKIL